MTRTLNPSSLRRLLPLPLLALAAVAHAGHWETTYSGGTGTPNQNGGSSLGSGPPRPYAMFNDGTYGGGGADASGTIIATLTWTADGPGDTSSPPATVYVLESCRAEGISDNGGGPSSSPGADADNGLGSKKIRTTNTYYGTYSQYDDVSQGTRVSLQSAFGGSVQVTATPHAAGGISASVHYSAAVTPYALSIHSDRDESFHKGANGPESNTTDVLTPRFGDTWVDPSSFVRQGNQDDPDLYDHYVCAPTFFADLIGGWNNPYHVWNVDGTSFTDSLISEWNSVSKEWDYGIDAYADLSDNPDSKVVTLKVTDNGNNGVSENATYTLRIHHPYEKWHTIGDLNDVPEDVGDLKAESPGVAYIDGSIHCNWNNPGPVWKLLSVAVTVGSSDIKGSVWKYFFKAAGIAVTDLGPKPDGGNANYNDVWAHHSENYATITGGDWSSNMADFQMTPRLVLVYHAHKYEADGYGPNGYTGPVREGATEPKPFRPRWSGDFSPYTGGSSGGA